MNTPSEHCPSDVGGRRCRSPSDALVSSFYLCYGPVMQIGDRVIYVENDPVVLGRDTGTITDVYHASGVLLVFFDDGMTLEVDGNDVRPLKESATPRLEQDSFHLHFGCGDDPCPMHS